MSKHLRLLLLLALTAAYTFAQDQPAAIIPQPVRTVWGSGNFFINTSTVIVADESERPAVEFFNAYLKRIYGLSLHIVGPAGQPASGYIRFTSKPGTDAGASTIAAGQPADPLSGRYQLFVVPASITIAGDTHEGTFYGMQTCGSVIQISGKHHPDDPGTIGFGGSPKQGINSRPMEILAWPACQPNEVAIHLQVTVGRRQINVPFANFFPVSRVGDG